MGKRFGQSPKAIKKDPELPQELIAGVERALKQLLPSVQVSFNREDAKSEAPPPMIAFRKGPAFEPRGDQCTLSLEMEGGKLGVLQIKRARAKFSEVEKLILQRLDWALPEDTFNRSTSTRAEQLAIGYSLGHILAFRLLRNRKTEAYDTPATVIRLLQDLAFERYEGAPCTSGFLYCSSKTVAAFVRSLARMGEYSYAPFQEELSLDPDFFKQPLTFRYVDGANALYLVDGRKKINGVVRIKDASQFDLVDRVAGNHFRKALAKAGRGAWLAYVGKHNDLWARTNDPDMVLHWNKSHWRVKDIEVILAILKSYGCKADFAARLASIVLTLSELRMGTGVLVLKTAQDDRPSIAGAIDNSEAGLKLRESVSGKTLDELIESHHILGLLSSDGLTTMTCKGELVAAGEIISLEDRKRATRPSFTRKQQQSPDKVVGGGRSLACRAASQYGLAIKVSEDGPITIYQNQKELIRI